MRGRWFRIVSLLVTLLIAGGLSYLASPSPDGLDSALHRGCQVVEQDGVEQLAGHCIARDVQQHPLAGSPLADYSVRGVEGSGGLAGVIGVVATLALAGAVFGMIARNGRTDSRSRSGR